MGIGRIITSKSSFLFVSYLSVKDAVSVEESLDKGQVDEDSTELDP